MSGVAISFWRGESCYGWWPQSLEMAQWDDPHYFGDYFWVSMAVAEERARDVPRPAASIARGVLFLPPLLSPTSSLLSIDGRHVLDLHQGANDVSHLAPGIYFVRERSAVSGKRSAVSVRKIVMAR
jgi:hypothetical protein